MSSVTLEDFLTNFTVRVVEYKAEDDASITVHFEVRCIANNRLSIHIASVDVSSLQEYTSNDVLGIAWDNVKSNVNDWATTNIVKPPYSVFTPESSTDDISLTDLNNNFTVRVCRWELYPKERPTSWCVGFEILKNADQQSKLTDCTISINTLCNNTLCQDIMTAAWNILKPTLCSWASQVFSDANVINTIYVPVNLTI